MKDRLAEFRSVIYAYNFKNCPEISNLDVEKSSSNSASNGEHKQALAQFFDEIARIRDLMAMVKSNVAEVESVHAKLLSTMSSDKQQRNKRLMKRDLK